MSLYRTLSSFGRADEIRTLIRLANQQPSDSQSDLLHNLDLINFHVALMLLNLKLSITKSQQPVLPLLHVQTYTLPTYGSLWSAMYSPKRNIPVRKASTHFVLKTLDHLVGAICIKLPEIIAEEREKERAWHLIKSDERSNIHSAHLSCFANKKQTNKWWTRPLFSSAKPAALQIDWNQVAWWFNQRYHWMKTNLITIQH